MNQSKLTAIHEAGHSYLMYILNMGFEKVSINQDQSAPKLGLISFKKNDTEDIEYNKNLIKIMYAGGRSEYWYQTIIEHEIFSEYDRLGSRNDFEKITSIVLDQGIGEKGMIELFHETDEIIISNIQLIDMISESLIKLEILNNDDLVILVSSFYALGEFSSKDQIIQSIIRARQNNYYRT